MYKLTYQPEEDEDAVEIIATFPEAIAEDMLRQIVRSAIKGVHAYHKARGSVQADLREFKKMFRLTHHTTTTNNSSNTSNTSNNKHWSVTWQCDTRFPSKALVNARHEAMKNQKPMPAV